MISLTQSFKNLTGNLLRPVALAVDIEIICFVMKQRAVSDILKSLPGGFVLLTNDLNF